MSLDLFSKIKTNFRGTSVRVIFPISALIIISMSILLFLHIYFNERLNSISGKQEATTLFNAVSRAIDKPMRAGDDETVQHIVEELKNEVTIYISDEKGHITYSSQKQDKSKELLGLLPDDFVKNIKKNNLLEKADESIIEIIKEKNNGYLIGLKTIPNSKQCHHCHGSSKKILGAFFVKKDITDRITVENKGTLLLFAIAAVVLISTVLIVILLLNKLAIKPIKELTIRMKDLATGEADLTKKINTPEIDCACVMECNKPDCPSYGKETTCWTESGSYSAEIHCPKISSGEYRSCDECIVYNVANETELDELSTFINTFIFRIKHLVAKVINNSKEIYKTSEILNNESNQLLNTANTTKNQIANSTDITTNTKDIITNVASAIEEMTATINEIAKNASNAREISQNAENNAANTKNTMSLLLDATQKIESISAIIGEIAKKTNLLALNATIESARAGEAGKGFAVVANEVKELAKQTSVSVNQIDGIVKNLMSQTQNVSHEIDEISDVIQNIFALNDNIAAAIEQQSAAILEISQNAQKANSNVDVLKSINENLEEQGNNNTDAAIRVEKASKNLNQLFVELKKLLDEFRT